MRPSLSSSPLLPLLPLLLLLLSSANALSHARSISIACWVVVFSPQIIENFRRGSADGLSLQFIIVWLAGDVFNILGAVLQGVLPTMVQDHPLPTTNYSLPVPSALANNSVLFPPRLSLPYTTRLPTLCCWDSASTTGDLRGATT